ncbi:hypothetical protein [Burkholderia gladioli]|uniref:hypothetical protein n=1 Tax=Burkholderia gladioli TaxID=28095 RepID=UPI003C7A8A81
MKRHPTRNPASPAAARLASNLPPSPPNATVARLALASKALTASARIGGRSKRPFGPDIVSAPTSSPLAPNTGADTEAVSGSRSPRDTAQSCSRTSASFGWCSVKARSTFLDAIQHQALVVLPHVERGRLGQILAQVPQDRALVTADAGADHRAALFRGTAAKVYRLG